MCDSYVETTGVTSTFGYSNLWLCLRSLASTASPGCESLTPIFFLEKTPGGSRDLGESTHFRSFSRRAGARLPAR